MSIPLYSLLALSIILMTCYADSSNNTSTVCAPSDCGNGVSIRYPFWRRSTNTTTATAAGGFCGYPEFGLDCSRDGHPILTLPTDSYYVTDINYVNHSITLVDIDVVNQSCPRAQHNVNISTFPLSFSSLDMNLTFYFNCSDYPSSVEPIGCMSLRNSEGKKSYVFEAGHETDDLYDWHMRCKEQIVVPVKQDEIPNGGLINGFGAAMNEGFVLDWIRAVNCAECEQSEGFCGYNQTIKQPICICRDGSSRAKSCKKGTLVSAC